MSNRRQLVQIHDRVTSQSEPEATGVVSDVIMSPAGDQVLVIETDCGRWAVIDVRRLPDLEIVKPN